MDIRQLPNRLRTRPSLDPVDTRIVSDCELSVGDGWNLTLRWRRQRDAGYHRGLTLGRRAGP